MSLDRWHKEKWVIASGPDKGKPCGAKTESETKYCRPSKRVSKDTPKTTKEMSSTQKRKKAIEKSNVGMGNKVKPIKRKRIN